MPDNREKEVVITQNPHPRCPALDPPITVPAAFFQRGGVSVRQYIHSRTGDVASL